MELLPPIALFDDVDESPPLLFAVAVAEEPLVKLLLAADRVAEEEPAGDASGDSTSCKFLKLRFLRIEEAADEEFDMIFCADMPSV